MAERTIAGDPRTHMALASAALLALVFAGGMRQTANVTSDIGPDVTIAVEHAQPMSLMIEMSTRSGQALIVLRHDGREPAAVTVPSAWIRREVRGAALSSVTSDDEMFGFVRWNIPSDASVEFAALEAPGGIMVHNPSPAPLSASVIHANLDTNEIERNVVLIKDEPTRVW